ncbi:hypothetical protein AKJ09_03022 [Labilithrix luteola]|uniref:Uncharacterized protein n=1 Tax=Labilithrix luteola TaxID=1391654 RepID=A0A0K1PS51_9BACT|nr:hypothetical protein AKJ09_03022 [Labilithrix luteola]
MLRGYSSGVTVLCHGRVFGVESDFPGFRVSFRLPKRVSKRTSAAALDTRPNAPTEASIKPALGS